MSPSTWRRLGQLALAAAFCALAIVEIHPSSWKTAEMTPMTPRLEAIFAKTRTVCFGRLLIDLPEGVDVIWGSTDVPLGVNVYPGGVQEVVDMAAAKRDELASEKMMSRFGGISGLIDNEPTSEPFGRIVTGYECSTHWSSWSCSGTSQSTPMGSSSTHAR